MMLTQKNGKQRWLQTTQAQAHAAHTEKQEDGAPVTTQVIALLPAFSC